MVASTKMAVARPRPNSLTMRFGLGAKLQRCVEAGAEAFGEQVVLPPGAQGGGRVAGVGGAEAHVQHRQRQQDERRQRRDEVGQRPALDLVRQAIPDAAPVAGVGGVEEWDAPAVDAPAGEGEQGR